MDGAPAGDSDSGTRSRHGHPPCCAALQGLLSGLSLSHSAPAWAAAPPRWRRRPPLVAPARSARSLMVTVHSRAGEGVNGVWTALQAKPHSRPCYVVLIGLGP
eukprot:scaffold48_cov395-Prasinococcus_capsulatus_cf.AAC.29